MLKLHRLRRFARILVLTGEERRYLRAIRKSGLFDRTYYRGAYPGLNPIYLKYPEKHYIAYGEQLGYRPNPDFSPQAYLRYHPDVAEAGVPPFLHYVRVGHAEQRLTKELPEVVALPAHGMPQVRFEHGRQTAPYAVAVHVYYPDLWPEFAARLRRLRIPFDLYVTLTYRGEETDALAEEIRADFPGAFVTPMPNRGRDILPFVTLLNAGAFDGYRAVCKFHTKKSPHRQDGDLWRQHLIEGILPETGLEEKLEAFIEAPEAGFWVADGQHYTGTQWWGSNVEATRHLLQRIEIPLDREALSFPAGSIYWVKPLVLGLLRSLQLRLEDFDIEEGQVDGTLAHAIERVLGYLTARAGQKVLQTSELGPAAAAAPAKPAFVSAFYLPQFHPVPENDAWWGKGFTEWRSVVKAPSMFEGHLQPMLPADLGFYDLRATEVMGEQAAMARAAGIDAFCVYHYWFDGRRILEAPIDRLMARPEIDFPFYLCWANESWRRNWDGLSGTVLLEQSYGAGFEEKLAADTAPYLRDPRYARPDGRRPRFVIYRPEDMPDPQASVAGLREGWRRAGIGEVELGAVRFHVEGAHPVPEGLFDFWVEMPPHGLVKGPDYLFGGPDGNRMPSVMNPAFSGLIYDYAAVARRALSETYVRTLPKATIAGIMPGWDNTARRGAAGHVAYGANPATFNVWLAGALERRVPASYRRELFVNAWNEWAEKAVLEPSLTFGDLNLQVMRQHLGAAEPATHLAEPPAHGMRSH